MCVSKTEAAACKGCLYHTFDILLFCKEGLSAAPNQYCMVWESEWKEECEGSSITLSNRNCRLLFYSVLRQRYQSEETGRGWVGGVVWC